MARAAEGLTLIVEGLILLSQAFADVGKTTCALSVSAKGLSCGVL